MTGELRRRTNKKKTTEKRGKQENSQTAATGETIPQQGRPPAQNSDDDETLWQTFTRHPLVVVAPYVLIPYALYMAYYFFRLQRPDLVTMGTFGLLQMRPAVRTSDERQVLVVGTMSSGTLQVARDLSKTLHLEISHEAVDAEWYFARDGTVSWFHGIRFLEPAKSASDQVKSSAKLCLNFSDSMGFHPKMYRPSKFSSHQKWSNCWAKECLNILRDEWGCGLDNNTCPTPFYRTLHQVRNPMATIESLVAKFCQGGLNGTLHASFVNFASALFPNHNFEEDSCIEATSHYALEYTNALLQAREAGSIHAMYQVEETSPCEVARLAGFLDDTTVVYPPNYPKVTTICEQEEGPAVDAMTSSAHRINVDLVRLEWNDLQGGMHGSKRNEGDKQLATQVKALMDKLGYNTNLKAGEPYAHGEMYLLE